MYDTFHSGRMCALVLCLAWSGAIAVAGPADPIVAPEDLRFLEALHAAVLDASRVPAGASAGNIGPNTSGGTLIRPGGRNAYPAFWIRDYAMSLAAGGITADEQRHHLLLTAGHQMDNEVTLPSGSVLPPGSIPDHISFGGVPIFFPGNLQDYDTQGGEKWGLRPCIDDHFYFVHMADQYVRLTGDSEVLDTAVNGKTLLDRLEAAYALPESRPDTGIVFTTDATRGVNFGFMDTTIHTGDLLFASLLKYRAALQLAGLMERSGHADRVAHYRDAAARLKGAIPSVFSTDSGWLRASTGKSAQCDVWGTAFALYLNVLDGETRDRARQALATALRDGTIAWEGGIRHVPADRDARPDSAWEVSYAAHNTYQNGAYWNTPVGWVVYAVAPLDRDLARQLVQAYLAQIRADDFRQGPDHGAPWECRHPDGNHQQNPVYLTSVAIPLAVFREVE